MEAILDFSSDERSSFELYKSGVCHRVKEMGDLGLMKVVAVRPSNIKAWYARIEKEIIKIDDLMAV